MKYFLIMVLLAVIAVVAFFLMRKTDTPAQQDQVVSTYVCDECGEHECICHEEDK